MRLFFVYIQIEHEDKHNLPNIWRILCPTKFPAPLEKAGPKHSTSVPFSVGIAVAFRIDVKKVAFVPNPVPVLTMKGLPDRHE